MMIEKYEHLAEIINNHNDQSQVLFSHQIKCGLPQQKMQQPHMQHGVTYSFIMVLGVISMMLLLLPICNVDAVGYSYTRFIGPVTGPEHKIYVNDANSGNGGKTQHHGSGSPRLDYVGKPKYEFAYGVEDADAHILHNRNEVRDGDAVKGVYSIIDPDGTLRVVKYTADEINGFQAEVIRNGVSSLHGQLQNDYNRAPPSMINSYNTNNNVFKPDQEQHHYPQSQTHLKGDRNAYYSSSNAYTPNFEPLPQIIHEQYNPYNQQQTPPQPSIIYHYNKNNDGNDDDGDDDGDGNSNSNDDSKDKDGSNSSSNDSDSDYHEVQQPHYEVHEKPNNDNCENPDDDHYDEDGHGYKLNSDVNVDGHKNKKHHKDEDKDDEDYDDDDENDSEELEDYNETVYNNQNSEESNEYY